MNKLANKVKEEEDVETCNQEILESIQTDSFEDRAYGCILGSFIGDSCGAFLKSQYEIATEGEMDECMTMPGGGELEVGAG